MDIVLNCIYLETGGICSAMLITVVWWWYAFDEAKGNPKVVWWKHREAKRAKHMSYACGTLLVTVLVQYQAVVLLFAAPSQPKTEETIKTTEVTKPTVVIPTPTVSVPMTNTLEKREIYDPPILTPQDSVANRNKNPLNLKFGSETKRFIERGDAGLSNILPTDGGSFIYFQQDERGFEAARDLICSSIYQNITIDAALRKWSNNGYNGDILGGTGINRDWQVEMLSDKSLAQLLVRMARYEGYENPESLLDKVTIKSCK